jgi:hypothetical protein
MPPIKRGRFTLNVNESRVLRDNTRRYSVVALDEWDISTLVTTHKIDLPDPMAHEQVIIFVAGLNSGKIPARFDLT